MEGPEHAVDGWDRAWRDTLTRRAEVLVKQLWSVGIDEIFLDGSFVEAKPHPNDIDGYFVIGRWLIGLRIAKGLTQRELADLLDVSPSQVSRDENNEYHGITVDRAQRILEALGVQFEAHLEEPVVETGEGELVPA